MSRIIVKNLGTRVTEKELRNLFGEKGSITDVQLKYTKDGRFRHFAFVGFRTEGSATEAVETFNGSYIGATKVSVEICHALGDPKKPRAWSKYAKDSTAYQITHKKVEESPKKKKKKHADPEEIQKLKKLKEDDPKFSEFLSSHSGKKRGIWGDDGDAAKEKEDVVEDETEPDQGSDEDDESKEQEPMSDMQFLKSKMTSSEKENKPKKVDVKEIKYAFPFTIKIRGIPEKARKKDIKHFLLPIKPKSIRRLQKGRGIVYVGLLTEKEFRTALNKDRGFMGANRVRVTEYKKRNEAGPGELSEKEKQWQEAAAALEEVEGLAESGRLFLRNLSYSTTEDDVQKLMSQYGPLTEVNLPIDRHTRKLMGFGLVTFMIPEHAQKAYEELDGSVFQGRMLHILPAKPEPSNDLQEEEGEKSYKGKKAAKMRAEASSSHNWNTLFLGSNAVAEAIASKYGTTKQKVLSEDLGGSVAVKMALGETQLVHETRKFLMESGVELDAFNQEPLERSKTVILIKNLPAKTRADELRELFSKYGKLGRVVLPPSGVTAIVEYLEPAEARMGFKKLAYKKFHYLPLYLEWAPSNCFNVAAKSEEHNDDQKVPIANEPEPQSEELEGCTLFVKNLNFDTTDEKLKEHFSSSGDLVYATVSKKKDLKKPGEWLSMGYGFVCFYHKASAQSALKTLQHSKLDGHVLELKASNRTLRQPTSKGGRKSTNVGKQKSSKLLVRNVPFQANERDLRELFRTFGQLKAVRLPSKVGGSHRGFGFIEYLTKQEAKQAFDALCQSTHLYGRRLVLEWAKEEEGIDEVRKRTAQHFLENVPKKRTGKATFNVEDSVKAVKS